MEIPRRRQKDLMHPAELAILESAEKIESLGASERLTKAVTLLAEAFELVADEVDGMAKHLDNHIPGL